MNPDVERLVANCNDDLFMVENDKSLRPKITNSARGIPAIVVSGPHEGKRGLLNNYGDIQFLPFSGFRHTAEVRKDIPMRNIATHHTYKKLWKFDKSDIEFLFDYQTKEKVTQQPGVMQYLEKEWNLNSLEKMQEEIVARDAVTEELRKAKTRVAIRLGELVKENSLLNLKPVAEHHLSQWETDNCFREENPENESQSASEVWEENNKWIENIRSIYREYQAFTTSLWEDEDGYW